MPTMGTSIHHVETLEISAHEHGRVEWLRLTLTGPRGEAVAIDVFGAVGLPTILDLRKRQEAEADAAAAPERTAA